MNDQTTLSHTQGFRTREAQTTVGVDKSCIILADLFASEHGRSRCQSCAVACPFMCSGFAVATSASPAPIRRNVA